MIEGYGGEIDERAEGAEANILSSVNYSWQSGVNYGSCAHRAGLHRYVKRCADQPPAAQRTAGLLYCEDLGVMGGAFRCLTGVVCLGDDPAVPHHDGADGHLVYLFGRACKLHRTTHIGYILLGYEGGVNKLFIHSCSVVVFYLWRPPMRRSIGTAMSLAS